MNFTDDEQNLIQLDPFFSRHIQLHGTIALAPQRHYFEALASSIILQQISVKAAAKIFARFKDVTKLEPAIVARLTNAQTKVIGLSGQKTRYIQDLADHFLRDDAVFNHLGDLSDDGVIDELTKVKGIGVWTAQMFLLFTLHRPDIFAPDDRGLQIAIQKLYALETLPAKDELVAIAEKWAPYRSTACLHLWRMLDNTPT